MIEWGLPETYLDNMVCQEGVIERRKLHIFVWDNGAITFHHHTHTEYDEENVMLYNFVDVFELSAEEIKDILKHSQEILRR